jgi:hypothetical protein
MAVTTGEDRSVLALDAPDTTEAPFRYYLTPHIGGSVPGTTATTVVMASEGCG